MREHITFDLCDCNVTHIGTITDPTIRVTLHIKRDTIVEYDDGEPDYLLDRSIMLFDYDVYHEQNPFNFRTLITAQPANKRALSFTNGQGFTTIVPEHEINSPEKAEAGLREMIGILSDAILGECEELELHLIGKMTDELSSL